jgi:hypothetical protein
MTMKLCLAYVSAQAYASAIEQDEDDLRDARIEDVVTELGQQVDEGLITRDTMVRKLTALLF